MALSLSDLPWDELLDIVEGPAVKKLDLAFFGEDENDVPLPPVLRFTVRYRGERCVVVVQADALQITGRAFGSDNVRWYNLTGTLLKRNPVGESWLISKGIVEIASYSPKGGQHNKGVLRLRDSVLQPIFWV